MLKKYLYLLAVAGLAAATPAWSAGSVMGRISYIYPDGHRLILDSRNEYRLAANIDVKSIGVAQFVRLSLGQGNMVTAVSPGPASLASYWAPKDTQS